MSKMNLKEVESELDDLSIRILELMNDHVGCKLNIERAVRSGCLDLAKTRYILGNSTSVSAMKVPTEDLSATTMVSSTTEGEKPVYELKRETLQKSSDNNSKNTNQDPLKWFGILVPSNLRQGQAWFSKGLDLAVQNANISIDISTSIDKYNKLMSVKNSLKSEPKEL